MGDDLVKVALRIRPLLKNELEHGNQECIQVIPGEPQVYHKTSDKSFTYNYVFPPSSSQDDFYDTAIKPMIPNIFKGFNVTILAYGQTGSGKTFSMGTNYSPGGNNGKYEKGVIPRAVEDIFNTIRNQESDWIYRVNVSFVELYQEQLYDLLANKSRSNSMVEIREDSNKKIIIAGLTEMPVNNASETLSCLAKGSSFRATAATAMNDQSSRSHAVFTLNVHQENKFDSSNARTSKFHLVDLAGSERSKKTQAVGQTFREGVDINKGLLMLGNVISQLGEGNTGAYVNYRDSKLTRLLQDSLGGNSVTLMIACVSPAESNHDETLSTLRYADRARKIKNKPIVNDDPKVAEVNQLKRIIQDLNAQLANGGHSAVSCPPEHEELQNKIRSYVKKLNENYLEMLQLHEKLEEAQEDRVAHEKKIQLLTSIINDLSNEIKSLDEDDKLRTVLEGFHSRLTELITPNPEARLEKDNLTSADCDSNSANNSFELSSEFSSDGNILNATYNIDKEFEEHTDRQAERHSQVSYIDKQLAAKENLIAALMKNLTITQDKEIEDMEKEIKKLHSEKMALEETLQSVQANVKVSKISETRRKRIQELEKKISDLTKKVTELSRVNRSKEKLDTQINSLKKEMENMKRTKVTLVKQMRSEADRFNKWKLAKERECNRLKAQDRKQQSEITKLQLQQAKQNIVFKRKMEESQAVQKRYKLALDKQKAARDMRNKTFKKPQKTEDFKNLIQTEIDLILSNCEAKINLEHLKEEKNKMSKMLLDAKSPTDKTAAQQEFIANLEKDLHINYTQIMQVENQLKENAKEACTDSLLNVLKSVPESENPSRLFVEQLTAEFLKKLKKAQEAEEKASESLSENVENNTTSEDEDFEDETDLEKLKEKKNKLKELTRRIQKRIDELKPNKSSLSVKSTVYFTDEEIDNEDYDKDPDWQRTPLFNRIKKLDDPKKSRRLTVNKSKKRSSNGDIACNCKSQCRTKICSCQKSDRACLNCNCDPAKCQNRERDTKRELFEDITNADHQSVPVKKAKSEIVDDSE